MTKSSLRLLWWFLALNPIDWVVSRTRRQTKTGRVLLVRLDAIGDFVLWLDAAKEYRRIYPKSHCHITLLGDRTWIRLAERLKWFDAVIPFDRRKLVLSPFYRYDLLRRLRRLGFCTVIQPTFSRDFLWGDSVVRIPGARERIGSTGDPEHVGGLERAIGNRWYTRLIPATEEPLMELERNAEFLRGLGLEDFRAGVPDLSSLVTPRPKELRGYYYVLLPGSLRPRKCWPLDRFEEIARRIHRATGWAGIVCGGPGEEHLGEALASGAGVPIQDWVGRTTLTDLIGIAAGAGLVFGNDAAGIHIAAAVSTPAVCVVGGGHPERFFPYRPEKEPNGPLPVSVVESMDCFGCSWVCVHRIRKGQPAPCIVAVSVDSAWDAVNQMIRRCTSAGVGSGA